MLPMPRMAAGSVTTRRGQWSDDTQMAAGIALVSATGADPTSARALDEIADKFLRWAGEGATDIGVQTSNVLRSAVSPRQLKHAPHRRGAREIRAAPGTAP